MPEDDTPGCTGTRVSRTGCWQRRFGSDPAAVGITLVLNGEPHEIAECCRRDSRSHARCCRRWAWSMTPRASAAASGGGRCHGADGRGLQLLPGPPRRVPEAAQAELYVLTAWLRRDFPETAPPKAASPLEAVPLLDQWLATCASALRTDRRRPAGAAHRHARTWRPSARARDGPPPRVRRPDRAGAGRGRLAREVLVRASCCRRRWCRGCRPGARGRRPAARSTRSPAAHRRRDRGRSRAAVHACPSVPAGVRSGSRRSPAHSAPIPWQALKTGGRTAAVGSLWGRGHGRAGPS